MDFCQLHVFEKHELFPTDRKSNEYKKINFIRTKLLKINATEATNYINQKIRINSQNIKDYLKNSFGNITINLKTKQIQSARKTRVSFIPNLEDIDIQPFIHKCNHHYHKFQNRKKIVLAKHGLNFINQNSNNNEHNNLNNHKHHHHHKEKNSKDLEELLYLLTGEITQKTYFNYLHSLCYTFHNKNQFKVKVESAKNIVNYNNFAFKNNDKKIKTNDSNEMMERKNSNNELKKSSSDNEIFTSNIIHLIRCKKIKAVI